MGRDPTQISWRNDSKWLVAVSGLATGSPSSTRLGLVVKDDFGDSHHRKSFAMSGLTSDCPQLGEGADERHSHTVGRGIMSVVLIADPDDAGFC